MKSGDKMRRADALFRLITAAFFVACLSHAADRASGQGLPPLTNIVEVTSLTEAQAEGGYPVRLRVFVVSKLRPVGLFFVTDGTNSLAVLAPRNTEAPEIGDRVEVEGVTVGAGNFEVLAQRVNPLPTTQGMPEPQLVGIGSLVRGETEARWVEVNGHVVDGRLNRAVQMLLVRQYGDAVWVAVRRLAGGEVASLRHAVVRVRGVVSRGRSRADGEEVMVWVGDREDLTIEKPAPLQVFNRPAKTISEALDIRGKRSPKNPVKVVGLLETHDGRLRLRDAGGALIVAPLRAMNLRPGDVVAAFGYLDGRASGGEIILNYCDTQTLGLPAGARDSVVFSDGLPSTLEHHVPMLKRLPENVFEMERAVAGAWPARLQAGINYWDAGAGKYFAQIGSVGAQLRIDKAHVDEGVSAGSVVEVSGFLQGTKASPILEATEIRLNPGRDGTNVFEPTTGVRGQALGFLLGRLRGQWLTQDGVVRHQVRNGGKLELEVARRGLRFHAVVDIGEAETVPDLLGSAVEISGVADVSTERFGVSEGARLLVPSLASIQITEPFDAARLKASPTLVADMPAKVASGPKDRILTMEGVVTARRPGRIFVSDDSGGIEILPAASASGPEVGERVRVSGYAVLGETGLYIEDALVSPGGERRPVVAEAAFAHRIPLGGFHGRLVSIEARYLGLTPKGDDYALFLADGSHPFSASIGLDEMTPRLAAIAEGSWLRVTGVCEVDFARDRSMDSFRLLLRSAEDVALLESPPWWTPQHTLLTIGGLVLVLVGSVGWVAFLRRRVEQTQGRFATAFDANPLPVAIVTLEEQRVLSVNESFLTSFGFARGDVIGKVGAELGLWADADQRREFLDRIRRVGAVRDFEGEVSRHDGRALRVILSAERIEIDGEECLLMIWQDITDRLNLLNQLRESQKMEAVGQLAAGVAHDFNNLLTIIRGNSQLLRDRITEDSEEAELNHEMDTAAARAADLTRQLLAFSRKQVMRPTTFDLNTVVTGSIKMLQRVLGETIKVRIKPASRLVPVRADAGMVDQIIMNLAINARDAMAGGGELTLSTSMVEIRGTEAGGDAAPQPGEYAVLEIADTGEGMDADTRARIFEPFFTTKELGKGTGLGLSTVYGVIRQHHGWIEVSSEPGQGACFKCLLPAAEAGEIALGSNEEATAFIRGTETILMVEDDPAVSRMIRRTLAGSGYEVLSAASGPEARRVWLTEQSRVDLVLSDVVMPGGVTGVDLVREFRGERPDLPVLLMSGYGAEAIRSDRDLPAGTGFLAKPFSVERLLDAVRASLRGRADELTSI